MEVSSRITKSLFYFLEKKQVFLPSEDLQFTPNSPLGWLDPLSTAIYIQQAEKEYIKTFPNAFFYKDWAEASFSLRAWDGLDSVLRIMPAPEPERFDYFLAQFFSYFISPSLELKKLPSIKDNRNLETSISEKTFPEIAKYLSACISYIPCFNKSSSAECNWTDSLLQIKFFNQQETIFDTAVTKTHITPELMNSLLEDFQKKEELLILREKFLIKKEKSLEARENSLLLREEQKEKKIKNSLFSSVGQLFGKAKPSSAKGTAGKKKTNKQPTDQFSFDID